MEYISATYGLVSDTDPTSENGQLHLVVYSFLRHLKKERLNTYRTIGNQLENSEVEVGLYHRNPLLMDRCLSHDNLSAIFSWSAFVDTEIASQIWSYLLKHLGTYDNTKGKSKQLSRFLPFAPANFFIWGLCAKSRIYLLFFPFYLLNLLLTCAKPASDTSGKILTWVELYPHQNHWLCKHLFTFFEWRMCRKYNTINYLKAIMTIYHGRNSGEYPINKILGINQ